MNLFEQVTEDMKAAMKSRDKVALETLRLLLSDLKNERIKKGDDLEDGEAVAVIKRSLKRRREAAEMFRKGDREDLASNEDAQAVVLERYMPRQLTGDDLAAAVDAAIAETGAATVKDMGKVMKVVMSQHAGQVDGKAVQALVREKLLA